MEKSVFEMVRVKTPTLYVYHVVGTPTTYTYDVKNKTMNCEISGIVLRTFSVCFTYEQFQQECRFLQELAILKKFGKN